METIIGRIDRTTRIPAEYLRDASKESPMRDRLSGA